MSSKIQHRTMSLSLFEQELLYTGITKKTAKQYVSIIQSTIEKYGSISYEVALKVVYETFNEYSACTANRYASALKAYSKCCKLGWEDQIRRYKETPAPKRQPSVELAKKIIEIEPEDKEIRHPTSHQKYSLLFELMFLTGMRLDEVRRLKIINVSEFEIILEKTKTGAGRRIATPPFPEFQKRLFSYIDNNNSNWVFPTERNRNMFVGDMACRKEFSNRLERLGIKYNYTPHTFRGAFMTRNLRNGAVLFDVQDIVGHTSADTTKIYYRGGIDSQRELMKHDPASIENLKDEEKLQLVTEEIKAVLNKHNFAIEMKESKKEFTLRVRIDEE